MKKFINIILITIHFSCWEIYYNYRLSGFNNYSLFSYIDDNDCWV